MKQPTGSGNTNDARFMIKEFIDQATSETGLYWKRNATSITPINRLKKLPTNSDLKALPTSIAYLNSIPESRH